MIGVHIDNTVHQIDINENDLQVDYFIHDHDSDTRYLIVEKDETNKVLLLKKIYKLYLSSNLLYVFESRQKMYFNIGTLIENGNNGVITYFENTENTNIIIVNKKLKNGVYELEYVKTQEKQIVAVYYVINEPKFKLFTHFLDAHGSQCTTGSYLKYFTLPDNFIVIMNCHTDISRFMPEAWENAFNDIFTDIQTKYTNLEIKLKYINTLLRFWGNTNFQFCIFTSYCPDLNLHFNDNLSRMGLYQLPVKVKNKPIDINVWASRESQIENIFEISSPHKPDNDEKNLDDTTLKEFIETYFNTDKSKQNFNVLLVSSCRNIRDKGDWKMTGLPITDPNDPMLHVYFFKKIYDKMLQGGGGIQYNYGGSKFKYYNNNLYTCKGGKYLSLEEFIKKQNTDKEKTKLKRKSKITQPNMEGK
jgi:hypothetical protein